MSKAPTIAELSKDIPVEHVTNEDTGASQNGENENGANADGEQSGDNEGDNASEENGESQDEENNGEGDASGEGENEGESEVTNEEAKRIQEKMQKRIDKLTAKNRTTETEKAELQKLLDAKVKDGEVPLTEDEVERRSELKANEKLNKREFDKTCEKLATAALKLDPKFNDNIQTMAEEIGLIPPVMIGILDDLENGANVLAHLAKNPEEAEEIYKMSPAKMAISLAKLADKVVTKTKPKPVSQVPPPNATLSGSARGTPPLNDSMTDNEWIRKFQAKHYAKR